MWYNINFVRSIYIAVCVTRSVEVDPVNLYLIGREWFVDQI